MAYFEMQLGYSTGAIAFGDFKLALERLRPFKLGAVELSALRLHELTPLVDAMPTLALGQYAYVAFHAPSRFTPADEPAIVDAIEQIVDQCDAIIVHPDAIRNHRLWARFGSTLCFENMDKRKRVGRTAGELAKLFDELPESSLCLDLGHAWQFDRTMTEARQILRRFRHKVRQLHVSEVNTQSEHGPLTLATVTAFHKVLDLLPEVPWILEAITPPERIGDELKYVRNSFAGAIELISD